MAKMILSQAFTKVKSIKVFNLESFIMSVMEMFAPVLKMLIPSYSKRLWVIIFEHTCRTYLLMVITMSTQYSPKESKILAERLKTDKQTLKDLFTGQIPAREIEESYADLDNFENCLRVRIEEIIEFLVPLAARLGNDFNDNCVVGYRLSHRWLSCD